MKQRRAARAAPMKEEFTMQELTLWMQMSLDGYASGPDGAFDWPVMKEELQRYTLEAVRDADGFVYGRRVYEIMAGFWPTADARPGKRGFHVEYAKLWREIPKFAVSRTLERADWNTTVVSGDLAEEIGALKAQQGNGLICFGGPQLASQLIKLGLVDILQLFVHPVVVGGGAALFSGMDERIGLRLIESRSFDGAVVGLRYRRG